MKIEKERTRLYRALCAITYDATNGGTECLSYIACGKHALKGMEETKDMFLPQGIHLIRGN